MSSSLTKKSTSTRFQSPDTDIEALQERLIKSIDSAFDPTAAFRSDNYFLAQDYGLTNCNDSLQDPFKKNPYQALAEKARSYVEKAAAERPAVPKPKITTSTNKKSATFVTYLEMDGNLRSNKTEPIQEDYMENYTPIEPITYDNILGEVTSKNNKEDDLEELRRMIKKTKRNINAYGRELISLKKDVIGINDYAAKELGYVANNELVYNMENAVNTLKRQGGFNPLKKDNLNGKGGKPDENAKKLSKTGSTKSILSSSGANTLKSFNTGMKMTSGKGNLKKW